ncbi:MAG: hypothetical protein IJP86_01155 [Synergistaceae bacterium]|nr:hypothetical protein [Synergistaceae bacterium]
MTATSHQPTTSNPEESSGLNSLTQKLKQATSPATVVKSGNKSASKATIGKTTSNEHGSKSARVPLRISGGTHFLAADRLTPSAKTQPLPSHGQC